MCEVKLDDRSEFGTRPHLLLGAPDRSMTPTNDSGGTEEICEFNFDLDELLSEIDSSGISPEKDLYDTSNILEEYISELAREDKNCESLCSSFVSSIEGEASSCYSAVSFVEQCSQEIMGVHLNPVDMEVCDQDTLTDSYVPLSSPRTDPHLSYSSPSLSITIPQAAVSTLGRYITSVQPAKPTDPTASQLKASLSSLECFQSHAYNQNRYFDFSTLSPDDVIRKGRDEAAH